MTLTIRPWSEADLPVLVAANAPEMTEHLGGPETEAKVLDRHRRYCVLDDTGRMFVIEVDDAPAGSVGYWQREWQGEQVYEAGWTVLPAFQGRGVAVAATRLVIERARAAGKHRWLHAYPSVDHPASNAVCRKAGFTLSGACDFEYPPGHPMRCNDWRLDLSGPDTARRSA